MDPITALSLASNVAQFVGLGIQIVTKWREIYQNADGNTDRNAEIEADVRRLRAAYDGVEAYDPLRISEEDGKSSELINAVRNLESVQLQCRLAANDLLALLDSLKSSSNGKNLVKTFLRTTYKAGDVEKLAERYQRLQHALESQTLVYLKAKVDFEAIRRSEDFNRLTEQQRHFVASLSQGITSVAELVRADGEETRVVVSRLLSAQNALMNEAALRDKLLESLAFPGMWSRAEQIRGAHRRTCEWIFKEELPREVIDANSNRTIKWDIFTTWLTQGDDVYWMEGKAGSGKSTLMSFVTQNRTTSKLLETWVEGSEKTVQKIYFYFWKSGSNNQSTLHGLQRSILYQMLANSSAEVFSAIMSAEEQLRGMVSSGMQSIPWTDQRLKSLILAVLRQAKRPAYCLFIDGLDECTTDLDNLIDFLADLTGEKFVKACVSSRPGNIFEERLGDAKRLKLQDLTSADIMAYVKEKFDNRLELNDRERLALDISRRADGVFLWVYLVVKSLLEGIRDGDTLSELQSRLRKAPQELDDLYDSIFAGMSDEYRQQAMQFFCLVERNQQLIRQASHTLGFFWSNELSLLQISLAMRLEVDKVLSQQSEPLRPEIVADYCRITRKRIMSRCHGLLEIVQSRKGRSLSLDTEGLDETEIESLEEIKTSARQEITFLHRTLRDYIFDHVDKPASIAPELDRMIIRGIYGSLFALNAQATSSVWSWQLSDDFFTRYVMMISEATILMALCEQQFSSEIPVLFKSISNLLIAEHMDISNKGRRLNVSSLKRKLLTRWHEKVLDDPTLFAKFPGRLFVLSAASEGMKYVQSHVDLLTPRDRSYLLQASPELVEIYDRHWRVGYFDKHSPRGYLQFWLEHGADPNTHTFEDGNHWSHSFCGYYRWKKENLLELPRHTTVFRKFVKSIWLENQLGKCRDLDEDILNTMFDVLTSFMKAGSDRTATIDLIHIFHSVGEGKVYIHEWTERDHHPADPREQIPDDALRLPLWKCSEWQREAFALKLYLPVYTALHTALGWHARWPEIESLFQPSLSISAPDMSLHTFKSRWGGVSFSPADLRKNLTLTDTQKEEIYASFMVFYKETDRRTSNERSLEMRELVLGVGEPLFAKGEYVDREQVSDEYRHRKPWEWTDSEDSEGDESEGKDGDGG